MEREINQLIAFLVAIKGYAKNIHYSSHGYDFYGKHLFADLISDPLDGFIDSIKEVCLLGHLPEGVRPLETSEYDAMAKALYPELRIDDDAQNFVNMQNLIIQALELIDTLELSKGEENLIGNIAEHLQKMNGLLNLNNFK